MIKFDNAITQIIFVEYPEGVEVMHLTKVYENGCLVDYELIYADGTSDEFCKKWGNDFVDCENLSPITIKASDFKEFKNELKGAIKMRKSKLNKITNEIIEANMYVKRGLYKSFYIEHGEVWLVPLPEKTFYENESICFYWAKLTYQQQTYINKLNPKFTHKLYKLALLIKAYINDNDDWRYYEYVVNNFRYVACELLDLIYKNYIANNYLPPTLELMYKLAHWIKVK